MSYSSISLELKCLKHIFSFRVSVSAVSSQTFNHWSRIFCLLGKVGNLKNPRENPLNPTLWHNLQRKFPIFWVFYHWQNRLTYVWKLLKVVRARYFEKIHSSSLWDWARSETSKNNIFTTLWEESICFFIKRRICKLTSLKPQLVPAIS